MSSWSRIINVFRRDRLDRDIDEEMQLHIEEAIESGRDPEEARRAFGSTLRQHENSRDVRIATWLDSLRADLIFGWRQLRKNKAASAAAILSLALAMGSCIAAFRLIDALLLRPLPVADAARLYVLTYPYTDDSGNTNTGDSFDYPQFQRLRAAVKDDAELIAISAAYRNGVTFGSDEQLENLRSQWVSGWLFSAFGLKPALGRLLTPADDVKSASTPVAVLTYDYWTRRFGRDPKVVGRKLRFGTNIYEIIGVCQRAFTGTDPGAVTDVFLPTVMNRQSLDNPYWNWFRIWVKLRPGRAPERVREELRAAVSRYRNVMVKTWPAATPRERVEEYTKAEVGLEPASAGFSRMQGEYRRSLAVLAGVVALVLLIASANVANLMVAQAAARAREMALRVSIGAGRWRLGQLVIVESLLVALLAAALGGGFAWWSAPFIVSRINPPDDPARLILPSDARVFAFAAALLLFVTVLFGIVPAVRASAVQPMRALRGGDDPHSRRRLMNALVAAQVAFCVVVHFASGLFVATFDRLSHQPTGFVADRLLTLETSTRDNKPSKRWDDVRQHLSNIPGVESAALCGWALMSGNGWSMGVWANGRLPHNDNTYVLAVSPQWLATMGISQVDGRDLRPDDVFPGTTIVNEAFARRYFDGRRPTGMSFDTMDKNEKLVPSKIVGYVHDARYLDMREPMHATVYVPFGSGVDEVDSGTFVVRTKSANALNIAETLRREIMRIAPELRVNAIRTQTELVEQHTVRERLLAMLSLFFAAVALALAGIGIYGVLNYSVLQRRREIGIRMALGSTAGRIAWGVTSEVFAMLAVGSVTGLIAGIGSERYVDSLLYHVKPTDIAMLGLPALTIITGAMLAALPPVLQAVRIDPVAMLREDA